MASKKKSKAWLKDLLVAFAGTTMSIILTFGTSAGLDSTSHSSCRRVWSRPEM